MGVRRDRAAADPPRALRRGALTGAGLTRRELEAARGLGVRDVIAPDLHVLFCGINPGLYTAAVGHHFGRPGNRFWRTLRASGFTERVLSPYDERELLTRRIGVTNLVNRATAAADELNLRDVRAAGEVLRRKVRRYRPRFLAVLGLGAYRIAFGRPRATVGEQPERIGPTRVWVLPNPSGRTAAYGADTLAALFRCLERASRSR